MKRAFWHGMMAALCVVGIGWVWANRLPPGTPGSAAQMPAPAMGHPAPDFVLTTLDGKSVHLSALRGQPLILNFWATWCPPCRGELPQLQAASERYAGQVRVIGVDQIEPAGIVSATVRELGLTYPIPLDGAGMASQKYGVRSLPTTFFIDRQGIIREIQIGGLTGATLADMLRSIYP